MRRRRWAVLPIGGVLGVVALFACGAGATASSHAAPDASVDHQAAAPQLGSPVVHADASWLDVETGPSTTACNPRTEMPPLLDSPHVPEGTAITYDSNPPSSGPHYPIWANFQEFAQPVADGYLVHSMEHGAVLLLYACDADADACTEMVTALRVIRDSVPTDPLCDPSIRVRIIIAPRPANDTPIAAAAWGNVYHADCVDPPSIAQFIADHYAHAPENFCSEGMTF